VLALIDERFRDLRRRGCVARQGDLHYGRGDECPPEVSGVGGSRKLQRRIERGRGFPADRGRTRDAVSPNCKRRLGLSQQHLASGLLDDGIGVGGRGDFDAQRGGFKDRRDRRRGGYRARDPHAKPRRDHQQKQQESRDT
jgi:hypothetical protein